MDDIIEEMLAEWHILDEQIPELPADEQPFDLDTVVPHPVQLPFDEPWFEILNDAIDEFEVRRHCGLLYMAGRNRGHCRSHSLGCYHE